MPSFIHLRRAVRVALLLSIACVAINPQTAWATPLSVRPIAVTASSTASGSSPSYATDGNPDTGWNAGRGPTAWIQLDLGRTIALRRVRLRIGQAPNGYTSHRIFVGQEPNNLRQVATLSGNTVNSQLLQFDGGERNAGGVRYIRVQTDQSPSWVSWNEIEVFQGVEYVGYFRDCILDDGQDNIDAVINNGSNMVWLGWYPATIASGLQRAARRGAKGMIDVDMQLFDGKTLRSDWRARWEQLAAMVAQNKSSVAGFYLPDEPYLDCENCEQIRADFATIASEMKRRFPEIPVAVILSAREMWLIDSSDIQMLDWVGFDLYGEWYRKDVPGHIRRLEALLLPHQRMIAVPWAYVEPPDGTSNTFQDMRVQNINEWQKEVIANARYVAIVPFQWHDWAPEAFIGANRLPYIRARTRQLALSFTQPNYGEIFAMDESGTGTPGESLPYGALNGDPGDGWNAGGFPVQSLFILLPGNTRVGRITLRVAQSPAGTTNHILYGVKNGVITQIGTLRGYTQQGNTLTWTGAANDVSALFVQTTESPSWVSWNDIRMFPF